jgi:thioesterase domain-containing protein
VYVTGDRGLYDCEGCVHILGRADRQLKIRGYRIEPSVIEAALEGMPGVSRAHVMAREAADGSVNLEAHIIASQVGACDAAALRAALESQFIAAMVPTAFALHERFPLTANGKVDARRLLGATTEPEKRRPAYRDPRTQSEDVIARLWAELFELPQVGIDDDFFELGGHSLLAVRMTSILSERLAVAVPVSLLMQHSTVSGLAAALHEAGNMVEESLVVELRKGGTRPPFWMIHPVGGHVVFARRFVALLDREQNMLGIQARGMDGRRAPFESLPEMARHYLELIRSYQPSGPYYLGGPSLGGKVAYEIAQQLIAAGEQPALVVMFDTYAPGFPRAKPRLRWLRDKVGQAFELGLKNSVLHFGQRLLGQGAPRGFADYAGNAKLDPAANERLQLVVHANQTASRSYEVHPYPGTVTLFRASLQPIWPGMEFDDVTNGWDRFAERVDVEVVDTNHMRMFDEPAVRELARKFESCLGRAYQRTALRASRVSTIGGTPRRTSISAQRVSTERPRSGAHVQLDRE